MSNVLNLNPSRALTANITAAAGATATFYYSGTTTLATVYADVAATIAHPNPLSADASGVFAQVFVPKGQNIKAVIRTSAGVTLYTLDPVTASDASSFTVGGGIEFDDAAAVAADANLTYSAGDYQVAAGQIIRTRKEGFAYTVAASGATDHNLTTAGGVKLYRVTTRVQVRPGESITVSGNGDDGTPLVLKSGEMYYNGTSDVPRVPITGLFNIQDENGVIHLAIWPDKDGDGDYDFDILTVGNGYYGATSSIQFRFGDNGDFDGTSFGERGRLRFGTTGNAAGAGTTNVNFVQSGVDFAGTQFNDFGIGPYGSSSWWTLWQASTGNMGVGISSPRARLHVQSGASDVAVVQSSANTARLGFRGSAQSDDTTAMIGIDSVGRLVGRGGAVDIYKLGATGMQAGADNTLTCGTSAFRWSTVFAGTGTINTSDEREKQDIGEIPDDWLDAWADVQWCRYRWKDAVAEKGDGARWHTGLIAQRVRDAFAARGLDALEIGVLCYDEWTDEETGEARNRYGVRYDEAFALEAALMRRRMDRLERAHA